MLILKCCPVSHFIALDGGKLSADIFLQRSGQPFQLLAHHQAGYREIGPFVASLSQWDNLEAFFEAYREKLMAILKHPASRNRL